MSARPKTPASGAQQSVNPKRGELWQANLDPVIGAEMQKSRPVLVINRPRTGRPNLRLCVPLTDWRPEAALFYWCVTMSDAPASGLRKLSLADTAQMRALDLRRFETRLGQADLTEIEAIAAALARLTGYIDDPAPQPEPE